MNSTENRAEKSRQKEDKVYSALNHTNHMNRRFTSVHQTRTKCGSNPNRGRTKAEPKANRTRTEKRYTLKNPSKSLNSIHKKQKKTRTGPTA